MRCAPSRGGGGGTPHLVAQQHDGGKELRLMRQHVGMISKAVDALLLNAEQH